jgi:hypothetical protein
LKHYELADYILFDTPPINDLAWDRMEIGILSEIFGMITGKLQDIAKEHGVATPHVWRTIEHQFIGNSGTRTLQLEATLHNFI